MHKKYPYQSSHPRRRTSPSLRWASCAVSRQNMANECGKANAINRYKPTIWEQLIVSHIYIYGDFGDGLSGLQHLCLLALKKLLDIEHHYIKCIYCNIH